MKKTKHYISCDECNIPKKEYEKGWLTLTYNEAYVDFGNKREVVRPLSNTGIWDGYHSSMFMAKDVDFCSYDHFVAYFKKAYEVKDE
jgi:hypothetical protein